MQQLADMDTQADRVDVRSSRKRKSAPRRKVTVRLSEAVCGRLDVATDQPGVGKSMLVEAALAQFLDPAPSREALLLEHLDDMHARFDHLEHDVAGNRRDSRAARSISSRRCSTASANATTPGRRLSATSASRSWPNRSIAASVNSGLSCRRRSIASTRGTRGDRRGTTSGEGSPHESRASASNKSSGGVRALRA